MTRFVALLPLFAACAEPECTPEEYGLQCADEPGKFTLCGYVIKDSCTLYCNEPPQIMTRKCGLATTTCEDADGPGGNDAVCLGEVLGTCSTEGFVRCEGSLVVECVPDSTGALVLSRGDCAPYPCVGVLTNGRLGCNF